MDPSRPYVAVQSDDKIVGHPEDAVIPIVSEASEKEPFVEQPGAEKWTCLSPWR
jgi:hypothetical protein